MRGWGGDSKNSAAGGGRGAGREVGWQKSCCMGGVGGGDSKNSAAGGLGGGGGRGERLVGRNPAAWGGLGGGRPLL